MGWRIYYCTVRLSDTTNVNGRQTKTSSQLSFHANENDDEITQFVWNGLKILTRVLLAGNAAFNKKTSRQAK